MRIRVGIENNNDGRSIAWHERDHTEHIRKLIQQAGFSGD